MELECNLQAYADNRDDKSWLQTAQLHSGKSKWPQIQNMQALHLHSKYNQPRDKQRDYKGNMVCIASTWPSPAISSLQKSKYFTWISMEAPNWHETEG